MQSMKETAANIGASAKSGMDKTKATMQEKVEKMTAHDPMQKQMATEKKEERINQAEINKQEAREYNASMKQTASGGGTAGGAGGAYSYSTTGEPGQPTGINQRPAMPGHGTGQPMGQATEGVIESHPIERGTGTQRTSTAAHDTHVGSGANKGYGTGGAYGS